MAYAQIDWHDFVVVETVDFQPNESGKYRYSNNIVYWYINDII